MQCWSPGRTSPSRDRRRRGTTCSHTLAWPSTSSLLPRWELGYHRRAGARVAGTHDSCCQRFGHVRWFVFFLVHDAALAMSLGIFVCASESGWHGSGEAALGGARVLPPGVCSGWAPGVRLLRGAGGGVPEHLHGPQAAETVRALELANFQQFTDFCVSVTLPRAYCKKYACVG